MKNVKEFIDKFTDMIKNSGDRVSGWMFKFLRLGVYYLSRIGEDVGVLTIVILDVIILVIICRVTKARGVLSFEY